MNTKVTPELHLQLTQYDNADEVLDALVFGAFLDGTMTWVRWAHLDRIRDDATLLPLDAPTVRTAVGPRCRTYLAEGDEWIVRVVRWADGSAGLTVLAKDEAAGQALYDEVTRDAFLPPVPENENAVDVGFWHRGGRSAERRVTTIEVDPWPIIRRNYPRRVAKAVDRLIALSPDRLTGRILLLHGPPGTGKTTVLRAMAHAWRSWCHFDCVVDPDALLGDPGYLLSVVLDHDNASSTRPWRFLLLEDCDELIRGNAKSGSGQSLGRLLNLTDGLLGQGHNVIVGITTNEPLTKLHPAIIRPGRCIAHIEMGRFSRLEAIDWLGRPASIDSGGATLAELFELQGTLTTVENTEQAEPAGLYL